MTSKRKKGALYNRHWNLENFESAFAIDKKILCGAYTSHDKKT